MRIHWQFLQEGEISIHDDRWLGKPWGVLGGEPGGRGRKVLVKKEGVRETLGSKVDRVKVRKGDLLEWVTWGGGGWGNPLDREAETVVLEVRKGLVAPERTGDYGVVVKEDEVEGWVLNEERTDELRREMQEKRRGRKEEVFNGGGSWEELKEKCLEETGLEPPKAPQEVELRGPMLGTKYFEEWKGRYSVGSRQ